MFIVIVFYYKGHGAENLQKSDCFYTFAIYSGRRTIIAALYWFFEYISFFKKVEGSHWNFSRQNTNFFYNLDYKKTSSAMATVYLESYKT